MIAKSTGTGCCTHHYPCMAGSSTASPKRSTPGCSYKNLWEARVNHRTGAYRVFFGLAANGAVILAAYADVKKRDRFPAAVYKQAAREVSNAVKQYEEEGKTENEGTEFVSPP